MMQTILKDYQFPFLNAKEQQTQILAKEECNSWILIAVVGELQGKKHTIFLISTLCEGCFFKTISWNLVTKFSNKWKYAVFFPKSGDYFHLKLEPKVYLGLILLKHRVNNLRKKDNNRQTQ